MYFLLKMGIIQPAMLVYQRVRQFFFFVAQVSLRSQTQELMQLRRQRQVREDRARDAEDGGGTSHVIHPGKLTWNTIVINNNGDLEDDLPSQMGDV